MLKSKKTRKIFFFIFIYMCVILLLTFLLAPYLWMVSGSFKTTLEIQSSDSLIEGLEPSYIPRSPTIQNYTEVNKTVKILDYFRNSIIISLGTMILTSIVSLMAAYALSRLRFSWKNTYRVGLLSTQMFPGIAFLIPYFILFNQIYRTFGIPMKDTYWGMILTYTSFSLPFSVLMLKNYLDAIPIELDEQAMIDGCSRMRIIFQIILPVSIPGMITIMIYAFIMAWNEILFASVLTGVNTKTVSIGLLEYITVQDARWGGMMAACIIVTIPVLIFFTFLQKHIVRGLISGAIKQ